MNPAITPAELELFEAALWNQGRRVRSLLQSHPEINVNRKKESGMAVFHVACQRGHLSVVSLLLAHRSPTGSTIDVNLKNYLGETGFFLASHHNQASVVRLLLQDRRVQVNLARNDGCTPLRCATHDGHMEIIRWMLASHRTVNLGQPGDWRTDAIGAAIRTWNTEAVALLESYARDPEATRRELRGMVRDRYAAELFALVVFLSDDYVVLVEGAERAPSMDGSEEGIRGSGKRDVNDPRVRFFRMVRRLPLELQMDLCHWVYGTKKDSLPMKDTEAAFKELAKITL